MVEEAPAGLMDDLGDRAKYVRADVTDESQLTDAISVAAEGPTPLRFAVSCAGIAPAARILSRGGVPHSVDLFDQTMRINLMGSFNLLRLASAEMVKTAPLEDGARGVIVMTASIAAFDGQVGQIAYAASKAGVAGMALPAARDLASAGVRVCAIAPGVIDTPMLAGVSDEYRVALAGNVPFPRRLGYPEEFADLALFIGQHDYLNGETIRMDGSLRMCAS
jgi:NAD(P)-dependent dehydrogenase (short-subunit alcohol dehydrogenase family)